MLHKKRTGKVFHITKGIVEGEAIYEEVDERYAEKRIRMLQAQNLQIEQQFHRHLIAAWGNRPPRRSSIANRRVSTYTPRPSADGGPRKMSLDLTNIRSSFSQDSSSMAIPLATGDGYILSPATSFDNNDNSYMGCMPGSELPYSMVTPSTGPNSAQIPRNVNQQATTQAWNPQMPNWAMQQQQVLALGKNPTDQVQMWQQSMMQQPTVPDTIQMQRQFRDRLASAPELPLYQAPRVAPSGSISGSTPTPSCHGPTFSHSRGQSQPSNNIHNIHFLTQSAHFAMPASSASSPRIEAPSAETHSTTDFCPTHHSPMSPTAVATQMSMPASVKMDGGKGNENGDGILVSNEGMDSDYSDFSQFALHLRNSTVGPSDREPFGFGDSIAVEEFTSVSC